MKKVLLLFMLLSLTLITSAQERTAYCEIIGSGNFSGNKIKISFDFGKQGFSYEASEKNIIVDDKGTVIEFSSMIDALNYMSFWGWELHTAFSAAIKGMGAQETYRYILKKRIGDEKDVLEGIKFKEKKLNEK